MIIKTRLNNGAWKVFQGLDVEYLDRRSKIELPSDLIVDDILHGEVSGLPSDWDTIHVDEPFSTNDSPITMGKWVKWEDPETGEINLLVTCNEVYVCNDEGQTLEALR